MTAERDLFDDDHVDPDSVRSSLDELFLLVKGHRDSRSYMALMRFIASFRHYSPFNAMLVHTQMPGARHVLPVKRWIKEHGRWPKHGAQPLVMLQPKGPVMFGFDVSQTEGKALPEGFEDPFRPSGRLNEGVYPKTIENARRDGVEVQLKALGSTLGGYVRNATSSSHSIGIASTVGTARTLRVGNRDIPVVAEIVLNSNKSDETNYATLTHELAHLYCGHVGTPDPSWWPDRRSLTTQEMEFEAESVCYLVCQRAGLATPAVEYLSGYLEANRSVPHVSLDAVMTATQRVESMGARMLPPRESRRSVGP
jgi:hypothetical protein